MKTTCSLFLSFALVFTFFSCSSDSSNEETPNSIVDDTYYLVLKRGSSLHRIGNKTGKAEEILKIPGMGEVIIFNAVAIAPTKIYICERSNQPFGSFIHVYDKNTEEFSKNPVELSEDLFGSRPVIVSMDWDDSKQMLIAIITSEEGFPNGVSNVVEINPVTFQVENLDIHLGQYFTTISTTLKGSKLYASNVTGASYRDFDDFVEINLDNKTYRSLAFSNLESGLTNISSNNLNNTIFGYTFISNPPIASSGEPFLLDLDSGTYQSLLQDMDIINLNHTFKTYYDKNRQVYVSILLASDGPFIYEHNVITHENHLLKIEENGVPLGGSAIIDIIKE